MDKIMANRPLKALDAKCVIFDLDGTLVDTAPDLLATLNVLFSRRGHREILLDEIRGVVGRGARAMLGKGGALTGNPFSEEEIEALFAEYLEYYGSHIADKSRLFPGGQKVLDACRDANIPLAICTNKIEGLSVKLVDALGLADYFQTIVGADTFARMKPDPEGVHYILKAANCRPENALFIGDSETDLLTARNAGIACVLVDYGYTKIPVRELDPDLVISSLSELL